MLEPGDLQDVLEDIAADDSPIVWDLFFAAALAGVMTRAPYPDVASSMAADVADAAMAERRARRDRKRREARQSAEQPGRQDD